LPIPALCALTQSHGVDQQVSHALFAVMTLRSLLLPSLLYAVFSTGLARAQDLVPAPDPYAPYEKGTQGRYVPDPVVDAAEHTTANPVLWQQYQAVKNGTAPSGGVSGCQGCQSCNGACGGNGCGPCDRCSCTAKNFPWFEGNGHCDNWCVGPHWGIEASGLIMHREDANLSDMIDSVGVAPSVDDQFEYAPGARLFATAYNCHGWGMQVGYEGMNDWDASLVFPDTPVADSTRSIDYMSRLNSVEINFLPNLPQAWKVFSGVRYVQLDEDLQDFSVVDRVIPPPADPPTVEAFIDTGTTHILQNHLIGFQLGGLRDGWQVGDRLSFSGFANAGVYHNDLARRDIDTTITTVITSDDLATPEDEYTETTSVAQTTVRRDFSNVAFLGEAGASVSYKLTPCLALKSGYQVILLDGVGLSGDAFLNPDFDRTSVLFHGLQFGLEYRR
jgi:hypothetical protein